ncbi:MAG: insulinase family protein [Alicyclobacillus sp.]|nr:insulinase family protein [Alicyclobacillus sp.]
MSAFRSYQRDRVWLHVLQTSQFRTCHLLLKLCRPLSRETVTASALLPYLWMEGTRRHPSSLALARYTDSLFGASLQTATSKRGSVQVADVYASAPDEQRFRQASGVFEQVSTLVRELVMDPNADAGRFPEQAVHRTKSLQEKRIRSLSDDKMSYSLEQCVERVCRGRPEALPRLGFADDLTGLDGSALWRAHQAMRQDCVMHAYLVGDIGADAAFLEAWLAAWHPGADGNAGGRVASALDNRARTQPIPSRGGSPERVVERQNVQQGKLNLGFTTGMSLSHPDYAALVVLNGIFGGFPHSKLFRSVREQASLAYYASSRLDGLTGVVVVQTGIEPGVADQAEGIILDQLAAIQRGEVTEEELELTRKALQNQYRQALDQPVTRCEFHFTGALAGVERDVPDLLSAIEAVTTDDVVRVSQALQLDTVYFLRSQEAQAHA